MKLKKSKKLADVFLFDVEISESEIEVYQQCMEYVLAHVDPKRLEEEFGAYPDEIDGMIEDLRDIRQDSEAFDNVKPALVKAYSNKA